MKPTLTLLTALLLAPLAALHAADAALPSPTPWTLGERDGRRCLHTPEGKAFMMLGISHAGGAFEKGEDKAARVDAIERQLRGWGFQHGASRRVLGSHSLHRALEVQRLATAITDWQRDMKNDASEPAIYKPTKGKP